MGVRGLTTYARQHDAVISEIRDFAAHSDAASNGTSSTPVAIDAWAWVYELWLNLYSGETVQGGHYYEVSEHVHDFVHAWRSAHLEPIFYWDGPVPLVKQPTFLARRNNIAATNSAFMRSSSTSRASRSFQMECYPAPPLLGDAVRLTLTEIGVQCKSMPGEADGAVAEFAERNGGFAVSKDSDFFILCSRGQGRARYVPLDTIEYVLRDTKVKEEELPVAAEREAPSNDGFEAVTTRKSRNKAKSMAAAAAAAVATTSRSSLHTSAWPPSRHSKDTSLHSIRLRAYSSHALAAQLRLPPALLPLLGSVIGNDYSTPTQDSVLFRHLQKSTDKIREACDVVHTQWQRALTLASSKSTSRTLEMRLASKSLLKAAMEDAGAGADDASSEYSDGGSSSVTATPTMYGGTVVGPPAMGAPVDRVRSLIEATVNTLLERADIATHRAYYVSDGEKEACIESIIESVAAYSLLTTVDSTHLFGKSRAAFLSPTASLADLDAASSDRSRALELYRQAFEQAEFPPQLVSAMTERNCTPTIAPEDPDQKSVHVGAAREVRLWAYAVLFQVWGMDWARETMEEPSRDNGVRVEEIQTPQPPPSRYKEGERPDDVISVDTESTASAELDGQDDVNVDRLAHPSADSTLYTPPEEIKPPPAVMEHVRKGDKLVDDLVQIRTLTSMLRDSDTLPSVLGDLLAQYDAATSEETASNGPATPKSDPKPPLAPLLPLRTRLDIYRHALNSSVTGLPEVPPQLLPLAASLRHIIAYTARVAGESKKRLNWTSAEISAAVKAGCMTSHVFAQRKSATSSPTRAHILPRSLWIQYPSTRGIHLASTLQLTLESTHYLSSALLLPDTLAPIHTLFDGPLFQYFLALSSSSSLSAFNLPNEVGQQVHQVLEFVLHGQEEDLGLDLDEIKRLRKESKKSKGKTSSVVDPDAEDNTPPAKGKKKKGTGGGATASSSSAKNAFAMLLDQAE